MRRSADPTDPSPADPEITLPSSRKTPTATRSSADRKSSSGGAVSTPRAAPVARSSGASLQAAGAAGPVAAGGFAGTGLLDVADTVAGKLDAIAPTFGEILKSVGTGVAKAQRALDDSVRDTVKKLSDTKIDVITDVIQRIDDDTGLPLEPTDDDLIKQKLSVLNFITPSVQEWKYVALSMDMSVGGFDIPGEGESGQIAGANGDMGENNTAGLDPIFFFHHCNVDRMFWLWQKRHGAQHALTVIPGYAGTSSSDSQGPTPGVPPGTPLGMDSALLPFAKDAFGNPYTSNDCVHIEDQLGYGYGPGSFDTGPVVDLPGSAASGRKLSVRGIDRALFEGSFVIRASATVKDAAGKSRRIPLGSHSVLSRRNVVACANCMTHQEVIAHFPLAAIPAAQQEQAEFHIAIQHRGSSKVLAHAPAATAAARAAARAVALPAKLKFSTAIVD